MSDSPLATGAVALSIEVGALDRGLAGQAAAAWLLDRVEQHRLGVTWAVDDPAGSPIVDRLLRADPVQDIGLWCAGPASRPADPRQLRPRPLAEQAARAAASGYRPGSVHLSGDEPPSLDELARAKVRLIVGGPWDRAGANNATAKVSAPAIKRWPDRPLVLLRHGLWWMSAGLELGQARGWLDRRRRQRGWYRAWTALATQGGLWQAVVRLERLAQGTTRDRDRLDADLALIAQARIEIGFAVRPLGQLIAELGAPRATTAGSILRRDAA